MSKRVKIYTVVGKPDFIPLQAESLRTFCLDDHELVVVNNAATEQLANEIVSTSQACGVRCIKSEDQDHSAPSMANAVPLNWVWRNHVANDRENISVVLDFDMFLVGKFSFMAELGCHALAAVKQARKHVKYIWCGIVIADVARLPKAETMDWLCGPVDDLRVDVGGYTYFWLQKHHKRAPLKNIDYTGDIRSARNNLDMLPAEIRQDYKDDFDFQLYARKLLHYKRGSGWNPSDSQSYHDEKRALLFKFVQGAMSGKIELPDVAYDWRGWNSGILNDYSTRTFKNYWDNFDDPPADPSNELD